MNCTVRCRKWFGMDLLVGWGRIEASSKVDHAELLKVGSSEFEQMIWEASESKMTGSIFHLSFSSIMRSSESSWIEWVKLSGLESNWSELGQTRDNSTTTTANLTELLLFQSVLFISLLPQCWVNFIREQHTKHSAVGSSALNFYRIVCKDSLDCARLLDLSICFIGRASYRALVASCSPLCTVRAVVGERSERLGWSEGLGKSWAEAAWLSTSSLVSHWAQLNWAEPGSDEHFCSLP